MVISFSMSRKAVFFYPLIQLFPSIADNEALVAFADGTTGKIVFFPFRVSSLNRKYACRREAKSLGEFGIAVDGFLGCEEINVIDISRARGAGSSQAKARDHGFTVGRNQDLVFFVSCPVVSKSTVRYVPKKVIGIGGTCSVIAVGGSHL